ncbi:extensin-like [Gallus gallus]|uniref:extensin-like n=1 Tax=Gallus gallus TaxID=9031 RepID=UPI001F015A5A|nr:extensin-like [Gallus gallus]
MTPARPGPTTSPHGAALRRAPSTGPPPRRPPPAPSAPPQAVPEETPPPFAEHSPGAGAETFRSAPAYSGSRHHAAPTHLAGSTRRTRAPLPTRSSRPDTALPPSPGVRPRLASPPLRGGGSQAGA